MLLFLHGCESQKGDPYSKREAFLWLKVEFNSFSILNLSIGQVVLLNGILIVVWVKPSAWKRSQTNIYKAPNTSYEIQPTIVLQFWFCRTQRFREKTQKFHVLQVTATTSISWSIHTPLRPNGHLSLLVVPNWLHCSFLTSIHSHILHSKSKLSIEGLGDSLWDWANPPSCVLVHNGETLLYLVDLLLLELHS
jgi:uncharacterized protein YjeT (DUF2065 family)